MGQFKRIIDEEQDVIDLGNGSNYPDGITDWDIDNKFDRDVEPDVYENWNNKDSEEGIGEGDEE